MSEQYVVQTTFEDHEYPVPNGTLLKYAGDNVIKATAAWCDCKQYDYGGKAGEPRRTTVFFVSGQEE